MFYYMYKITNKLTGKLYVGVHKTKSMDDSYMGSGKVIKRAIEKYGIENFEKAIIETFDSEEGMYAREKEIVNDEFLSRQDVYNLRRGGTGGFDYINKTYGLNNRLIQGYNKSISPYSNPKKYSEEQISEWKNRAARASSLASEKNHAAGVYDISYDKFGKFGN